MKRIKALGIGVCMLACWGMSAASAGAATQMVTSTADSGAGSLRQAIADAAAYDTVAFGLPAMSTITLASTLTVNKTLTIVGPTDKSVTVSGNNAVRVLELASGSLTLLNLTVANGYVNAASAYGAGIYVASGASLTMDRCEIRSCALAATSAAAGAGIYVGGSAVVNLNRCYIHDNTTPTSLTASYGAGIWSGLGSLTIANCTISGNSGFSGPALYFEGNTCFLVNTTVSGNTSQSHAAIYSANTLSMTNCTVSNNTSGEYEAGLYMASASMLRNNVIAGNTASNGHGNSDIAYGGVASSSIVSNGYNLIGSAGSLTYTWTTGDACGTGSSPLDAKLGVLADNGGDGFTHMPLTGSPAIDPASSNGASWTDSRGYLRVNTADKGACEFNGGLPVALAATDIGSTRFTANWEAVSGASLYLVDVATDAGFANLVNGYNGCDAGSGTSLAVTGLNPTTTYYYRLRAYGSGNTTLYSNTESATTLVYMTPTVTPVATATPAGTVTPEVSAGSNTVRPVPNPANDRVRFVMNLAQAGEARVVLYNLAGERVAELSGNLGAGVSELVWECGHAAPGVYLARVKAGGIDQKLKIAIAR